MSLFFPRVSVTWLSWGTGWVIGRDDRRQCFLVRFRCRAERSLKRLCWAEEGDRCGSFIIYLHRWELLFFFLHPHSFKLPWDPIPPPSSPLLWHLQQHRMMINDNKHDDFFSKTYWCSKWIRFRIRFEIKNAHVSQYFWLFTGPIHQVFQVHFLKLE